MPAIIKNNKFDSLVDNLIYYFYFAFQFFFVLSGADIARNGGYYNIFTLLIIIPFILLVLCDAYYFLRGRFNITEIIIYFIAGLILLISLYNYRNVMVMANLIIISIFKNADGKKALKYYCYAIAIAFIIIVLLGIFTPFQGNVIQTRHGVERIRYGLGFFYCSLGQFYFLSLVLAYILIKEKLKVYEYVIFIIIDIILFIFTDTRAPFTYTIVALLLFLIIDKLKNTKLFNAFGILTICSFFISFFGMFIMSTLYNSDNKLLVTINRIVNSRLYLSHNSLKDFGFKLFGQYVPEALGDSRYYLDSSMMSIIVLHGVLVTAISLIFMTYFSYISYKTKKIAILVILFFIAMRGAFDLGFMAVQFSPVVILFYPTLKEFLLNNNNKLL